MPRNPLAIRLGLESLEDRTTPTFLTRPVPRNIASGSAPINVNGAQVQTGGLSIAAGDLLPDAFSTFGLVQNEYALGTGPGVEAQVRVWRLNGTTGGQNVPELTVNPFPGFRGGVNVAIGDVLGDEQMELIVAVAGNGPPHVKVFDGKGRELRSFLAFDTGFLGGLNVAVGNVLGGIAAGGYSGGQVSQDFKQEIIIGAASGGAPHVVVTDADGTVLRSFLAFDLGYRGGVTVAGGSINTERTAEFDITGTDTNSYDEVIVGAATDVPHVKSFEVWTGAVVERLSFYAFDPSLRQGVTVAAGSTDNQRGAEIYVSQITPLNPVVGPTVRVFSGDGQQLVQFNPYPPTYTQVVNMAVGYLTPGFYDPSDDDSSFFNDNFDFLTQDLVMVAGDGPFFQEPRYFIGLPSGPAGANGPP